MQLYIDNFRTVVRFGTVRSVSWSIREQLYYLLRCGEKQRTHLVQSRRWVLRDHSRVPNILPTAARALL